MEDIHTGLTALIGRDLRPTLFYLPMFAGLTSGLLTFPILRLILGKSTDPPDDERLRT